MFSGTAQVSHQVCLFFCVSSVCLLVRMTMVDKNNAVVCCLLATSAVMLSKKRKRKRKMWSKKRYLKRNISCDDYLLNELLVTDVPWDDAIVVSTGKLRELWDCPSELCSSVCEIRLERTVLRLALLPVKTAQFTQFFPSGKTSFSKIAHFNWECVASLMNVSRQYNWDGDHITVFWLSAPYSILFVSIFRLMNCLHLQGKSVCCRWILCDWDTLLCDHFSIHPNHSVILKLEADHNSVITVRTVSWDGVLQNRAGSCGDGLVSAVVQPEGSCCSPHPSASLIV